MAYKLYTNMMGEGLSVGMSSNLNGARKIACRLLPRPSVSKSIYIFKGGKLIGYMKHGIEYNYFPEYETKISWKAYDINPNTGRVM